MKKFYLLFIINAFCNLVTAQWTNNTLLNVEAAGVNAADIITKNTSDGKTWLAFYSQNGNNYDMHAQLLDANGNKMLGDNGIVVSTKKSGSATFVFNACVDNENNFIIAFQYQKGNSYEIITNKIDEAGNLMWGINGIELGKGLAPWPVALSNNDIVFAWSNDNVINYQKVTAAGAVAWSPVKVVSASSNLTRPQLVAFKNNQFGMVYQRVFSGFFYTHLWEQRYDENGDAVWANPVQLNNGATAVFKYYSVMAFDDTTFIGYSANPASNPNRFDAYIQRVNYAGTLPWGINGVDFSTDATKYYELTCEIAIDKTSYFVWAVATLSDIPQGKHGISAQKILMATGEPLFGVKAKVVFPVAASFESDENIAVCGEGAVFTYTDAANKLYAAKLNALGNFEWTGNVAELGSTTNQKGRFGFTDFVNNQAVAVWAENKTTEDRPYAQNISCDGQTGILPVSLLNFEGSLTGKIVNLYWQTVSENNNKGFYVQRAADGIHYIPLNFVPTKAIDGNSSSKINYTTADAAPLAGNNYYRLKQQDITGRYTYSNVVLIRNTNVFENKMHAVYPNPVHGTLSIYIESTATDNIVLQVYDARGIMVAHQNKNIIAGNNNVQLNLQTLPAGNYFIKLISNRPYQNASQVFTKQ